MIIFYNSHSGEVKTFPALPSAGTNDWFEYQGYEGALHAGLGWHKYTSAAELESAVTSNHWPQPTTDWAKGFRTGAANAAGTVIGTVTGTAEIGAVLRAFFQSITDVYVWRSLGWLALGVVMFVGGIFLWMKNEGAIPDIVPVPV